MNRTASLCISLLGALVNFAFAVQLLLAWRSLRWEPESEWEGSENSWRGDGVKLVWGLLSAYFAAAATVCLIGCIGIVKVRLLPRYIYIFSTELTSIVEHSLFRPVLPGLLYRRFLVLHLLHNSRHICRIPHLSPCSRLRGVVSTARFDAGSGRDGTQPGEL